jgi:Replicase family/Primase C terminal 1 (PriCT-1)
MLENLSTDRQHPALIRYAASLPAWLHATDNLEHGLIQKERHLAQKCRYTEIFKNRLTYLVLDVDRPTALFAAIDGNLPPPTLIVQNPANLHAHLFYALNVPVSFGGNSRQRPQEYFKAIQCAFTDKAKADPAFTHYISKNPLHPHWRTYATHSIYDLGELAECVKLNTPSAAKVATSVTGRNATLFDSLRLWAYAIAASASSHESLAERLLEQGELVNAQFPEPLPFSEVKSTTKSVADFCWKNRHKFGQRVGVMGFPPIASHLTLEARIDEEIRRELAGGRYQAQRRTDETDRRIAEALRGFAGQSVHVLAVRNQLKRARIINRETLDIRYPANAGIIVF